MKERSRQTLLHSLALTIADYRQGEITAIDPAHVDRWVQQFDASDQATILEEMDRVLKAYYVSRARAEAFIDWFLVKQDIFGSNPKEGVQHTTFLRVQRGGDSQRDLLVLVDRVLQAKYGLTIDQCGLASMNYVYVDDGLFSGNTALYDLKDWLLQAEANTTLHLVFFAIYSSGFTYLRGQLAALARQQRVTVKYWWLQEFRNLPRHGQRYECLWPRAFSDHALVDAYVQELTIRGHAKGWNPRLFRPATIPRQETLFSSPLARDVVERAFLEVGVYLVSLPGEAKPEMRPLGYEKLESLGFGATFVTYRNIANNCPLVLWWGDSDKSYPLNQWYPLFPPKRRTKAVIHGLND